MAAYIYLKSIAKSYNEKSVIADLSLGLEKTHTLAIVGKNNSGKSMLLKILSGNMKIDYGNIFIDGQDFLINNKGIKRKIAYIPEHVDFDTSLSVYQNLYLYMRLYTDFNSKDIEGIIAHWSNIFNFDNLMDKVITSLNSSMLRIIHLSRIFMSEPDIVILDQPTKDLDPDNKIIFWKNLKTVLRKSTVIYSSHDFEEIQNHSDRIAFLDNGKIRLNGSISDIMSEIKGYGYYRIVFADSVNLSFKDIITSRPDCYNLNIRDREVDFYSPNKKSAIALIKESFKYDVVDFTERPFSFKDIFLTQSRKQNG
tara:strand:+ start:2441 stop:3370 length:930 start_codon:yes stop_codon:yes gene_type:complete